MKRGYRVISKNYVFLITLLSVGFILFFFSFSQTSFTGKATENPFNLEVEIPGDYQKVSPGDTLWFTTKILNFANEKRVDVTLEYNILDENENEILTRSETVAIETQASFVGRMELSEDIKIGKYMLEVKMIQSDGKTSIGKSSFQVRLEEDFKGFVSKNKFLIMIILGIIVAIIFFSWILPLMINSAKNKKIKRKIKRMIKERKITN